MEKASTFEAVIHLTDDRRPEGYFDDFKRSTWLQKLSEMRWLHCFVGEKYKLLEMMPCFTSLKCVL